MAVGGAAPDGVRGPQGYLASRRTLNSSRMGAVKVIGSPFNAFEDAVDACNTMLVELERLKSAGEVKRAGSAVPATSPRSEAVQMGAVVQFQRPCAK